MTRAIVVGLGSIGQRHVEVLRSLDIDVVTVSRRSVGDAQNVRDLVGTGGSDYVVVATETSDHVSVLAELKGLGHRGPVLCEKPLAASLIQLERIGFLPHGWYVGYNLRFDRTIGRLREWLASHGNPISVQARAAQDLRQWRPGRSVANTASASSHGGGVLRDLSHELDYLTWMFGPWNQIAALGGHRGDLDIDSDDVWSILIDFESGTSATVELNYFDRVPARFVCVTSRDGTAHADLIAHSFTAEDGPVVSDPQARNATFADMHTAVLSGDPDDRLCSVDDAREVLRLIDAVERAAATRDWVSA